METNQNHRNLTFQAWEPCLSSPYPNHTQMHISVSSTSQPFLPLSLPLRTALPQALSARTRSINHNDSSPPALGGLGSSQSQGHEVPSNYKWVDLIDELTGIVQPPVRADEIADL